MKPSTTKKIVTKPPPMIVLGVNQDGSVDMKIARGNGYTRKTVNLSDLYASLSGEIVQKSAFLPPHCRQIAYKGDETRIILEVPAQQRMFRFVGSGGNISAVAAMPWTVMYLKMAKQNGVYKRTDSRIFARPEPLRSDNDPLFMMPFNNVHDSSQICWGTTFRNGENDHVTDLRDVYKYVDLFFASNFNSDLSPRWKNSYTDANGKEINHNNHFAFMKHLTTVPVFPGNALVSAGTTISRLLAE